MLRTRRHRLIVALAVIVLATVLQLAQAIRAPIADARQASAHTPAEARADRSHPPAGCPYSKGRERWPAPADTSACLRYNGTGKTVMIMGDSHAEHWVPALSRMARNHNWHLLSLTRAGCNPLNLNVVRPDDGKRPTQGDICSNWRQVAYPAVISRYDPDLVLIGGRSQINAIRVGDEVIGTSSDKWFPAWRRSWRWTVRVLSAGGAKIGALTLQPTMPFRVPNCLERYGLDTRLCDMRLSADRQTTRANDFVVGIHSVYPHAWSVPVTTRVCPDGVCEAVIKGRITHPDASHLTRSFSRSVAPAVFTMMRDRGLLRP